MTLQERTELKAARVAAFKEAAQQCDDRMEMMAHMASIAGDETRRAYWDGAATEAKVCGDRIRALQRVAELSHVG